MTGTNQREAGSQLAFDQLSTGFRPVRTSFYPAFSQLSAGFRPARVMECGLYPSLLSIDSSTLLWYASPTGIQLSQLVPVVLVAVEWKLGLDITLDVEQMVLARWKQLHIYTINIHVLCVCNLSSICCRWSSDGYGTHCKFHHWLRLWKIHKITR